MSEQTEKEKRTIMRAADPSDALHDRISAENATGDK
jgi:hypothetical protein